MAKKDKDPTKKSEPLQKEGKKVEQPTSTSSNSNIRTALDPPVQGSKIDIFGSRTRNTPVNPKLQSQQLEEGFFDNGAGSDIILSASIADAASNLLPRVGSLPRPNARGGGTVAGDATSTSAYRSLADGIMKQSIVIDDDQSLVFEGRAYLPAMCVLFYLLCFASLGLFYLLSRWFPLLSIHFYTEVSPLSAADCIVVTNNWDEMAVCKVESLPFNELLESVFPKSADVIHDSRRKEVLEILSVFEYRYFRFILNPISGLFEPNYTWVDPKWISIPSVLSNHPQEDDSVPKRSIFGSNQIEIEEKSSFSILFDEVLHPFFVFQIFSIILWSLDNYYYYASCILLISISSIFATFLETRSNIRKMQQLAKFSCTVSVFRARQWLSISSEELVPGDIFEINSDQTSTFPCDAVLLAGDCIVNESLLTGESLPVSKSPISDGDFKSLDFGAVNPNIEMSRFFLFSGTTIIRARAGPLPNYGDFQERVGAIALVVQTGFNTTKGSLIRSMLFPRPNTFKFYQDSFKFIGILALISLMGFLVSLYNFILLGLEWQTIVVRALDLITIAVPPALPATMAIGTTFALRRLKLKFIYCTSPPRLNICGKINVMCFDKTGTLTEEGLDIMGVRFTVSTDTVQESPFDELPKLGPIRFSRMYTSIDSLLPKPVLGASKRRSNPSVFNETLNFSGVSIFRSNLDGDPNLEVDFPYPLIVVAMATCHSIKIVNEKRLGDPLDLKMFQFTNFVLEEDNSTERFPNLFSARPPWIPSQEEARKGSNDDVFTELSVVHSFEFSSSLRRMSVILRRIKYSRATENPFNPSGISPTKPTLDSDLEFEVFVKGAPEALLSICDADSIPNDYMEQLRTYTHRGFRILAVGWKSIPKSRMSHILKAERNDVESNLRFLGFIIFENKVKEGTANVISTLKNATIRQVMVTGDNVFTSLNVARECGLVESDERIFVPRFLKGEAHEEDAQIVWEDVENSSIFVDPTTFLPVGWNIPDVQHEDSRRGSFTSLNSLISRPPPKNAYSLAITGDVFQWMIDYASDESFEKMLVLSQVFARFGPDQKKFLVDNFQWLGYTVGFCGDGSNDCAALKAADIGISLSDLEASVAAPFTSKSKDLDSVLSIIREGRAALVTSFCCFKYMALYSLIEFTSTILMYILAQNIGDFQFMFIDICLIIPIAIFMGQTKSFPSIYKKRPTASLVSSKVLCSMLLQVALCVAFQVFIFLWVRSQPFYRPGHVDIETETYQSFENTTVFLVSCFQYIIVAIVFTVGPPFQAPIWENLPLLSVITGLLTFTSFITLFPVPAVIAIMDFVFLPWEARFMVMAVACLNFLLSYCSEKFFIVILVKFIKSISDRIYVKALPPYSFTRAAKIRKWHASGKKFKIVQEELELAISRLTVTS